MGNVKGKLGDYFTGKICNTAGDTIVQDIQGTYMGYADFDGERLFDLREQELMKQDELPLTSKACLPSDCRNRPDLSELLLGNQDQAQTNKETLENIQRRDRKLRAAA